MKGQKKKMDDAGMVHGKVAYPHCMASVPGLQQAQLVLVMSHQQAHSDRR
jgi:hypothetical protein